jgi:hypothetical protein
LICLDVSGEIYVGLTGLAICPSSDLILSSLQIHQMLAELDNLEFGPGIGFREYSFLENPLLPHEVSLGVLACKIFSFFPLLPVCERNSVHWFMSNIHHHPLFMLTQK